jgi:hypothetical protein
MSRKKELMEMVCEIRKIIRLQGHLKGNEYFEKVLGWKT